MYGRRIKTQAESNQKEQVSRKKCNEALTMRCQISLTKMAQFLMDNGKYNGREEDLLADLQSPRPQKILDRVKSNTPKRPKEKILFPPRHKKHHLPLDLGAHEKDANNDMDNFDEVLPSESWLQFVRKDVSLSGSSESDESIVTKDQTKEIIFSKVIRIDVKSADPAESNSSLEFDPVENATNDIKTSLSASEPIQSLEATPQVSESFEATPPVTQSVEATPPVSESVEVTLPISESFEASPPIKIDSKVSTKKLSKYKFSIPSVTTNPTKHSRNFQRNRTRFSQGRRSTNNSEWSKNAMKKDPKCDIQISSVKIASPDINHLNRVCVNGSKIPAYNNKNQRSKTQKNPNTTDRNDKWAENKQEDCFDRWRPYSAGDSNESSCYGGGISQFTFQNIHEKDPKTESTSSSYTSESIDLQLPGSCSSVSLTSCRSQFLDHSADPKTKQGEDDISRGFQRMSSNSDGNKNNQKESSRNLNNNEDSGRLSANSQDSASHKKEEIKMSLCGGNKFCSTRIQKMQSNSDGRGYDDKANESESENPPQDNKSRRSIDSNCADCEDCQCTSKVHLFSSELTIHSSQNSDSHLKDTHDKSISPNLNGNKTNQIDYFHGINNNDDSGRLNFKSRVSASNKNEEINTSPCSSDTCCSLKDQERDNNNGDGGFYKAGDNESEIENQTKDSEIGSETSAVSSRIDFKDCSCSSSSKLDLFSSDSTINSSQESGSYLKHSRVTPDVPFNSVCSDVTVMSQQDGYGRALFSWNPSTPNQELPSGYYQGISSRYVQPVVIPPPFPGRDRANIVMKVRKGETKEGTNVLVKFRSDVKEYNNMPSHSHPPSKEILSGSNILIKNYRLDIKDNPSNNVKKGPKIIRRPLYRKPGNKRVNTRSSSFVERNIQSVSLTKLKNGQKNVLRLPVIDCDMSVVSRMSGHSNDEPLHPLF